MEKCATMDYQGIAPLLAAKTAGPKIRCLCIQQAALGQVKQQM